MPALLLTLLLAAQGPALAEEPRVRLDVPYRTVGGIELRLDAHLPAGAGPHPALLLLHGGAWIAGDKADLRELGRRWARKGYACFAPAYRLAPRHRWPAQIEDCVVAVQFVRAHAQEFGVDGARLGAMGFSAGGHLAAMLAVLDERREVGAADPVQRESTRIQCAVLYFAPSLLSRGDEYDFDTRPPPELFGDAGDDAYASASPVNFVTSDDPPFLLVHGERDRVVPLEHSILMEEELRTSGVSCELVVVPGGGHGDFLQQDPAGSYWQRTEAFLSLRLRSP